jgi:hypothetical protein
MVSFSRALSLTVAFANVGMGKSRVGESRGLGIRLPNPLSCQGNQLKEGENDYRNLGIRLVPQGPSTSSESNASEGASLLMGEFFMHSNLTVTISCWLLST